ncbi:MAG: hypothetical protein JWR23_3173 [Mucilaginibacter sp.]|nr:hypothetical protein [Mucilaginibacter sp.]
MAAVEKMEGSKKNLGKDKQVENRKYGPRNEAHIS